MTRARLRVCLISPEYPPVFWGGLARAVQRVARFVAEAGWDVHVANLYTEVTPPRLLDEIGEPVFENGVAVHRIPVGREEGLRQDGLWDSPESLSIRQMYDCLESLHRRYDFGVFHSFFIYPLGYVAALLARVHNRKLILSVRGNDINQHIFSPGKAAMLQSALRQADVVTAVAHDLLAKADALTPVRKKSRVIFNSIAPGNRKASPPTYVKPKGSVIGSMGLFKHSKGLPYLLKAFWSIRKERESSLLLVGDIREAEREVHDRYLSRFGPEGIHLTGPVAHESINLFLRQMDVFVIPSLSEGCPNVLLEAMAAARPIVATKTGAIPEILRHGETGFLVDPGSASQIKEAVIHVLDHPAEARAMGRRAFERIGAFSEERERHQWEEIYRRIARQGRVPLGSPSDSC